ncbi:MAG TPA: SgcJ/EcaC family oxidoreductase [Candidatus Acidoferrales bacterium]|nr:SgcJ/EcaC family oxidoreductase [Candidatus Acidoferrales bacterium]
MQEAAARLSDEQAIRETVAAWSQAAGAKDLNKCVSFYTDDACVLPFNAPIATGRDQIRAVWSHLMSNPAYSLRFGPTKIDVARSADLAYEIGTFDLTLADPSGKPTAMRGKYVVAWQKQANGEWKAAADIFNTDN